MLQSILGVQTTRQHTTVAEYTSYEAVHTPTARGLTSVAVAPKPVSKSRKRWRLVRFHPTNASKVFYLAHWESDPPDDTPPPSRQSTAFSQLPLSSREPPATSWSHQVDIPQIDASLWQQINSKIENLPDQAPWTFEETRYLFHLCRLFSLRFFVIADRYSFRPGFCEMTGHTYLGNQTTRAIVRPVEAIKSHFYQTAAELVTKIFDGRKQLLRGLPNENSKKKELEAQMNSQPFLKVKYDPVADRQRKAALSRQRKQNVSDVLQFEETRLLHLIKLREKILGEKAPRKKRKTDDAATSSEFIPVSIIRPEICRLPGPSLASNTFHVWKGGLVHKKVEAAIDIALKELAQNHNGPEDWTPVSMTAPAVDAYCALRLDVGLLINLRRNVESLTKEVAEWEQKLNFLQESMTDDSKVFATPRRPKHPPARSVTSPRPTAHVKMGRDTTKPPSIYPKLGPVKVPFPAPPPSHPGPQPAPKFSPPRTKQSLPKPGGMYRGPPM